MTKHQFRLLDWCFNNILLIIVPFLLFFHIIGEREFLNSRLALSFCQHKNPEFSSPASTQRKPSGPPYREYD